MLSKLIPLLIEEHSTLFIMVGAASPEEELLSALLGNVSCTVSSKLLFFPKSIPSATT